MIRRFGRIHREFGTGTSARIAVMLIGLLAMSIFGLFGFESWWPLVIAGVGLVVGFLLRRQIVDVFEWTAWALPAAGIIYGVLLFAGEQLGLSRAAQLMFITFTTVIVFNLQFWSLSDPAIVRTDDE